MECVKQIIIILRYPVEWGHKRDILHCGIFKSITPQNGTIQSCTVKTDAIL